MNLFEKIGVLAIATALIGFVVSVHVIEARRRRRLAIMCKRMRTLDDVMIAIGSKVPLTREQNRTIAELIEVYSEGVAAPLREEIDVLRGAMSYAEQKIDDAMRRLK